VNQVIMSDPPCRQRDRARERARDEGVLIDAGYVKDTVAALVEKDLDA
jgi:regulator of extracellular matrix RemA (YlzA/DUF370 family)